ncbi:MAG: hypothetical protein HY244_06190 [Rhizobiales bacterium]|nr:hypothetical protein [Hyphomicrobiales bacterium]
MAGFAAGNAGDRRNSFCLAAQDACSGLHRGGSLTARFNCRNLADIEQAHAALEIVHELGRDHAHRRFGLRRSGRGSCRIGAGTRGFVAHSPRNLHPRIRAGISWAVKTGSG